MDFSGKVSIVTGASQGIGEAIALDLAQNGAEIILVDIQKQKLDDVARKIQDIRGKAFAYEADVSDMTQIMELAEAMIQNHGPLHHE